MNLKIYSKNFSNNLPEQKHSVYLSKQLKKINNDKRIYDFDFL